MQKRTIAALLMSVALVLGCGEEFQTPSELEELRVLMLRSTPIEIQIGEDVVLEHVVYVPDGQRITEERWSFCPFTAGAFASFACVACEVDALPDPTTGELRFNPMAMALGCEELADLIGGAGAASGGEEADPEDEPPAYVETLFRYQVRTSDGESLEAVLRVPVWLEEPPEQENGHPAIVDVTLDGVAPDADGSWPEAGQEEKRLLRVTIDEDSLDAFLDSDGDEKDESAVVSFYATAGSFEWNRRSGTDVDVEWTAPDEDEEGVDEAQIYVVVRDLRGGQDLRGPYVIPIAAGAAE